MKPIVLLESLGNVKHTYVISAEEFRQGKQESRAKHMPAKRFWLIAAIIALTLLLVGCAVVYVLSLQDMAFGEEKQTYYDGSSQTVTLLSLQGVRGTPGYQASKEWYEWLQTYDTDGAIRYSDEAFSEDFGDDYYAYNLYSREMKDKLDEICAKYGLELLGKMYVDPDVEAGCKALQIQGIFRPGTQLESDFDNICYYANGSFDLEGYVTLSENDTHIVSFSCHRKDAFSDLYGSIGPEGTYEEWAYSTSYGVDVLMVIETGSVRGHALIIADRGPYVFLFSIDEFEEMPLPDKAELEAYAEAFDFTVEPQRVSQEDQYAADERREQADQAFAKDYEKMAHSFSQLGYENRIKFNLEYAVNPELLSFAVLDLEGNGTEDLLVGENGYIRAVYTTIDGGSQHMMPMGVVYLNMFKLGNDIGVGEYGIGYTYIYLCENNGLAYVCDLEGDGVAYRFASVKNGELVWTDRIVYDPLNTGLEDSKWQRYDENYNSYPITEEEFNRIVASYPRVTLDMYPISDYPLTDDSPSGIGNPPETYISYNDLVRSRTEWEQDRSNWGYQLTDLDGDGQQELIWKEGNWTGVFTMKDGQVKQLVSGLDVKLCEGNILAVTRSYLDGNKTHCYYKIVNGNAVLTDYLRYDADKNPDNPWMRSADNSGQDISMEYISQAKFDAICAKYTPLALDMKPIAEYPFT